MPPWGPIKRAKLIRFLNQAGFAGPFSGGKHPFMKKGEIYVRLPNPHGEDIGLDLVSRILRQARITREEWEKL